jgi:hypothetical protein
MRYENQGMVSKLIEDRLPEIARQLGRPFLKGFVEPVKCQIGFTECDVNMREIIG